MQLHELKPKYRPKKRKRVGRGGKRGTYSGRGQKGQKSRAGKRLKPAIRELIKRYPKLRGYKQKSKRTLRGVQQGSKNQKSKITILNLDILEKKFVAGEKITPQILLEKRIIRRIKGRRPEVKILGRGELTKKLIVEGCQVSKEAEEKIKKSGGTIK